ARRWKPLAPRGLKPRIAPRQLKRLSAGDDTRPPLGHGGPLRDHRWSQRSEQYPHRVALARGRREPPGLDSKEHQRRTVRPARRERMDRALRHAKIGTASPQVVEGRGRYLVEEFRSQLQYA